MEVQMVKRVAMLFGAVLLVVGLVGMFMVDGGMAMGDAANPPKLMGTFPVNVLHNVVHILFGVWGMVAARSFGSAQTFAKLGGVIYMALAVLGVVAPTTFGLIPIGGADVWMHAAIGVVLAGVGFTAKEESMEAASVPA
jgi:Domain of unknown function (DUF4383)